MNPIKTALITTESHIIETRAIPREIPYADLVSATKSEVEYESYFDVFGQDFDLTDITALARYRDMETDELRDSNSFVSIDRNGSYIIELHHPAKAKDFSYIGGSKQVLRQLAAQSNRAQIDYIKDVYEDRINFMAIACNYIAPNGEEYSGSTGMVGSYKDYPETDMSDFRDAGVIEIAHDVISEVIDQLEKDGFIVTGIPEYKPEKRARGNINAQNITDGAWEAVNKSIMRNRRKGKRMVYAFNYRDTTKGWCYIQFKTRADANDWIYYNLSQRVTIERVPMRENIPFGLSVASY